MISFSVFGQSRSQMQRHISQLNQQVNNLNYQKKQLQKQKLELEDTVSLKNKIIAEQKIRIETLEKELKEKNKENERLIKESQNSIWANFDYDIFSGNNFIYLLVTLSLLLLIFLIYRYRRKISQLPTKIPSVTLIVKILAVSSIFFLYHWFIAERLLFDLTVIFITALVGLFFYLISFKNLSNPRECKNCKTVSDIFDYDCNNCGSLLLKRNSLFGVSGLLIVIFFLLLSSLSQWKGFVADTRLISLNYSANGLNHFFNLSYTQYNDIFTIVALIILNLSILAYILERRFWLFFFSITTVVIYSLLFSSFDYILIVFTFLWFSSFFKFLNKLQSYSVDSNSKLAKIIGKSLTFFEYIILVLTYFLLIIGVAENLHFYKEYSKIITFIHSINEQYHIFQVRKIIGGISVLLLVKDITSIFYFDNSDFKKIVSSTRTFSLLTISALGRLFLSKYKDKIIEALGKFGLLNIVVTVSLLLYFGLVLVLQASILFILYKFNITITDYWYFDNFAWEILGVMVLMIIGLFTLALITNSLYVLINLAIFYFIETYREFGKTEKIDNIWQLIKSQFIDLGNGFGTAGRNLINLGRNLNVTVAVILTSSLVSMVFVGIFDHFFGLVKMEKYFILTIFILLFFYLLQKYNISNLFAFGKMRIKGTSQAE